MVQLLLCAVLDYTSFDAEYGISYHSLIAVHLITLFLDPGVIVYIKRLAAGVLSTINNSSDADGEQFFSSLLPSRLRVYFPFECFRLK